MNEEKEQVLIKAVSELNKHKFGLTGIKIELEANLRRQYIAPDRTCDSCRAGFVRCSDCANGWSVCNDCDRTGEQENGRLCRTCNGHAEHVCRTCCPRGDIHSLAGKVVCGDCDGEYETYSEGKINFDNTMQCQDFILKELVPLGLAERISEPMNGYGKYKPAGALAFAKFYRDGSVDSELTATVKSENPEDILVLPKIVEAFNKLAEANGRGCEVTGAGMHMALVTGENGGYPSNKRDETRYRNFKKSMTLLMPALYFLGTHKEETRPMGYRKPGFHDGSKYGAVSYRNGALEFRVFDTCYDKPEAILDNVVVMRNAMKYWRKKYLSPGLDKIAKRIKFGVDTDYSLSRLYCTMKHIDLLNKGLARLKPSYYTVGDIKKQRKFGLTKTHIKNKQSRAIKEAKIEYKEYEQRFGWQLLAVENRHRSALLENYSRNSRLTDPGDSTTLDEIEGEVKAMIERQKGTKKSVDVYIREKLEQIENKSEGEYTLSIS